MHRMLRAGSRLASQARLFQRAKTTTAATESSRTLEKAIGDVVAIKTAAYQKTLKCRLTKTMELCVEVGLIEAVKGFPYPMTSSIQGHPLAKRVINLLVSSGSPRKMAEQDLNAARTLLFPSLLEVGGEEKETPSNTC